jgi:hypothetical protein
MDAYLFYDSPEDALQKSIAASGKPQKEIACAVWPGRDMSTAKSLLSRSLSPENTDVNLTSTKIEAIMSETRPDDYIFYLCDKYGFERPQRKTKKDMRRKLEEEIKGISKNLAILMKRLPDLEGIEE